MQYHSLSQNTALNESSNVTDVSALEYFPLLVNSLLLFNRIIVNVFNFVIIIYESRSTSFSMKRRNQQNCFELKKKKRNVSLCYNFFLFLPNIKQSQEKKKNLFTLFSALGHQRTVFICSNCKTAFIYRNSRETVKTLVIHVYILFINVNIMSCLERRVKIV